MSDELQGGKQADGSPTPAVAGNQIPDSTGGSQDASPVSSHGQGDAQKREDYIPRERFDQVLESSKALERKVAELEAKSQQTAGQRSWQQMPEQDLNYIVTHSSEYPEHATGALSEIRRRDREALKSEILGEVGVNEFRSTNNDAFDSNTPLGQEVSKIMSSSRSQKEILSDVVELAKYRIGGNKAGADTRKKLIQNLQGASVMAPGADTQSATPPPSFMDMPKADFAKVVEKVKLGEFNIK